MTRHPPDFTDTDPRAMEVWLGVLRAKTPGERIDVALNLTDFALRMAESGVRANHPMPPSGRFFCAPPRCDCRATS